MGNNISPWGGGFVASAPAPWVPATDATWREGSSTRWTKLAFTQAGETHAVVGCGATSQMRSASCEAECRWPSDRPASMAWMWGRQPAGPYAAEEVVRYFRCEALEVPEKLRGFAVAHLLVHELTDGRAVRGTWTTAARAPDFSVLYGSRSGGDVMTSSTCAACRSFSCEIMWLNFVLSLVMAASSNYASTCENQRAGLSGQKGGRRTATPHTAPPGVLSGSPIAGVIFVRIPALCSVGRG
jgi:hypothetical protein